MRAYIFVWVIVFLAACQQTHNKNAQRVPDKIVSRTDTSLYQINGVWLYGSKKFSGYVVEYDGHSMVAKTSILEGRENGWAYAWYINKAKKMERFYKNGKYEGIHKGWWDNGNLQFIYSYKNDLYEGSQVAYYPTGQVFQQRNYVNGYEEGRQQVWNEKGLLIGNYTFKNGKRYGIVGRFDCMSVFKK